MASEEKQNKGDSGKGFAGLSSMISDVETTITSAPQEGTTNSGTVTTCEGARSISATEQEGAKLEPRVYQAQQKASKWSSKRTWLLGIGIGIILLWLMFDSDKKSSSPSVSYSNSSSSPATVDAPSGHPSDDQIQTVGSPTEKMPLAGNNNVLTTPQIRYCLAENIRLDAAKTVVNNYSESDVDRFNEMVADYNSRCSEFRYRQGALEGARAEVERNRAQIEAEGRSRFSSPY